MTDDKMSQVLIALQRIEARLDGLDRLIRHGDEEMGDSQDARPSVRQMMREAAETAYTCESGNVMNTTDDTPIPVHPDLQKALDAAGVIEKKPR